MGRPCERPEWVHANQFEQLRQSSRESDALCARPARPPL